MQQLNLSHECSPYEAGKNLIALNNRVTPCNNGCPQKYPTSNRLEKWEICFYCITVNN